jgi:AcrR family transcriptional regulator
MVTGTQEGKMPRAFTEYEKELIGTRLLEQGYELFSTYGLKKTSIGELADAAGISKGAFYIFYESKEALFLDVVELAEQRFRQEVLAVVDLPGPSARARLTAILKKAFTTFKSIPILQFLTSSDYDLLYRRISAEQLQSHLTNDQAFIEELVARCQQAGIPIRASIQEISSLFYALVVTVLHEQDIGPDSMAGAVDILLELVAAFCLGEVEIEAGAGEGQSR